MSTSHGARAGIGSAHRTDARVAADARQDDPEVGLEYYLVCVDGTGAERADDPDGLDGRLIPRVEEALAGKPYTDVFLMSHGWMGDVPAAVRQYDRWIGAMAACSDDLERARRVRPGFAPLLVGFHWPSLPFGDEELGGGSDVSFAAPGAGAAALPDTAALVDAYADRIADTPAAREALETIFAAAAADTAPLELSARGRGRLPRARSGSRPRRRRPGERARQRSRALRSRGGVRERRSTRRAT